jgi:preprotein translocase subunit YajC
MSFLSVLLQAQQSPMGGMFTPLFMVGMIAVMYFFMIRPQAKRAKEQKKFGESIAVGEDIVTTAGIHGKINRANENGTLQIEISRNTYMTIERSAVSMEMTTAFRKKNNVVATADTAKA